MKERFKKLVLLVAGIGIISSSFFVPNAYAAADSKIRVEEVYQMVASGMEGDALVQALLARGLTIDEIMSIIKETMYYGAEKSWEDGQLVNSFKDVSTFDKTTQEIAQAFANAFKSGDDNQIKETLIQLSKRDKEINAWVIVGDYRLVIRLNRRTEFSFTVGDFYNDPNGDNYDISIEIRQQNGRSGYYSYEHDSEIVQYIQKGDAIPQVSYLALTGTTEDWDYTGTFQGIRYEEYYARENLTPKTENFTGTVKECAFYRDGGADGRGPVFSSQEWTEVMTEEERAQMRANIDIIWQQSGLG